MSTASRSRIALLYSVRFNRWMAGRPGLGSRRAARSSAPSSQLTNVAASDVSRRGARRRHLARAHFPQHLLPKRRIPADVAEIQALERDAGGLRFLVVTDDAILFNQCSLSGQRICALRPRGRRGVESRQAANENYKAQLQRTPFFHLATHKCALPTARVLGAQAFLPASV